MALEPTSQQESISVRSESDDCLIISSQAESVRSTYRGFRLVPKFSEIFERKGYTKNRQAILECIKCKAVLKTNDPAKQARHVKACRLIDLDLKTATLNQLNAHIRRKQMLDDEIAKRRNTLLAKAFAECNAPMLIVECSNFIKFLKDLNHNYNCQSRHELSTCYVQALSEAEARQFYESAPNLDDYSLSIEFDQWTDIIKRSVLDVVATKKDGSRFLFDLADVSSQGHAASVLITAIKENLSRIPSIKINSIISDSASNCKAARSRLSLDIDYSHLIEHRCMPHFLNLIGDNLGNRQPFKDVISAATRISNLLSVDAKFLEKLSSQKMKRISTVAKTRWYSVVNMLESLLEARDEALTHLETSKKRQRDKIDESIRVLRDEGYWQLVGKALEFIRPLANSIGIAEREDGSLGEAVKSLLDFIAMVFEKDWNDGFAFATAQSILTYFNTDKLGEYEYNMWLACYYLDRRYKMDYITPKGKEHVFRAIINVALVSSVSGDSVEKSLYNEFMDYTVQRGILSRACSPDESARIWWKEQVGTTGNLRLVATRLANLKSSSANVERIFSLVKRVQGLVRTNYTMSTLTGIARSKIAMKRNNMDEETLALIFDDIEVASKKLLDAIPVEDQRRNSSIELSTSIISDEINRLETDLNRSDKLDTKLRRYYNEFTRRIDFSIVNKMEENFLAISQETEQSFNVDAVVSRFRNDFQDYSCNSVTHLYK